MQFPIPLPGPVPAPDGPDSSLASLGAAHDSGLEGSRGRASRRLDALSAEAFAAQVDRRASCRIGGALILLRLRHTPDGAFDALIGASLRAVRPGDTVGRLGDDTAAIWLQGLPHTHAETRAERLRVALHRQGVRGLDVVALPVMTTDRRDAAALLAAAAEAVGGLERAAP